MIKKILGELTIIQRVGSECVWRLRFCIRVVGKAYEKGQFQKRPEDSEGEKQEISIYVKHKMYPYGFGGWGEAV